MLIELLCRKTRQKETPNSPMNGGQGVEVSKTLFYVRLRGRYRECGADRFNPDTREW